MLAYLKLSKLPPNQPASNIPFQWVIYVILAICPEIKGAMYQYQLLTHEEILFRNCKSLCMRPYFLSSFYATNLFVATKGLPYVKIE